MATAAVASPSMPGTLSKEDEVLLVLARLMEGGQEDKETCRDLDSLTFLLNEDFEAAAADKSHHSICSVFDVDCVDTVLSYLDLRQATAVRGRAILTTSAYLRAAGEPGERNLSTFFNDRVRRGTYDDYIVAFCVAAACFPIAPGLSSRLFLAEGFLSSLSPLMRRTWKSQKVETACLEMLNAACMNSQCRAAIDKYCAEWLEEVVEQDPDDVVKAAVQNHERILEGGTLSLRRHSEQVLNLAAVILTKLRVVRPSTQSSSRPKAADAAAATVAIEPASASVEELARNFVAVLQRDDLYNGKEEDDAVVVQYAIEGLAYATLQPSVKESVANDKTLLQRIVKYPGRAPLKSPATYGAISVLVNLTHYRPALSEEEDKVLQLKAYANAAKPAPPDPLDADDCAAQRCQMVFDAGAMPSLLAHARTASPATLALAVQIVSSLSITPALRGKIAQQGAVGLLLAAWTALPETGPARLVAAQALARILISINPALVFGGNRPTPLASAIRPLASLLKPDSGVGGGGGGETRNLLPAFEGLMALTNLVSFDDGGTRAAVLRVAWPDIEELLLSSNTRVRRAAVELVCNLSQSPEGMALYVDGSPRARERFHLLLALADAEDEGTRSAAGGALAGLTAHVAAAETLVDERRGVDIALLLLSDMNEDIMSRGVVTVYNLVLAEGDVGRRAAEAIKEKGGVQVMMRLLLKEYQHRWINDLLKQIIELISQN